MKANEYVVIEQRGCSIDYKIFEGTIEQCNSYVSNMLAEQSEDYKKEQHERELFSGADRNIPFTYIVVIASEESNYLF